MEEDPKKCNCCHYSRNPLNGKSNRVEKNPASPQKFMGLTLPLISPLLFLHCHYSKSVIVQCCQSFRKIWEVPDRFWKDGSRNQMPYERGMPHHFLFLAFYLVRAFTSQHFFFSIKKKRKQGLVFFKVHYLVLCSIFCITFYHS